MPKTDSLEELLRLITRRVTAYGRQKERISPGNDPDRAEELFGRIVLENEPARAGS